MLSDIDTVCCVNYANTWKGAITISKQITNNIVGKLIRWFWMTFNIGELDWFGIVSSVHFDCMLRNIEMWPKRLILD